jgi:hypothetical protein
LDDNNRNIKFRVAGEATHSQDCEIDFDYISYGTGSVALDISDEEKAIKIKDALSSIRYSPQKFRLPRGGQQYINFSIRRSLSKESVEKRLYMKLKCTDEKLSEQPGLISLSPRLVHTIPMVIRTGTPEMEAKVTDVVIRNNNLSFNIQVEGNRSIYGDLKVMNKDGKLVYEQKGIAIYPESKYRSFNVNSKSKITDNMKIIFEERKAYGGSLSLTFDTNQEAE